MWYNRPERGDPMNQKGNEPMTYLRIRIPSEMKEDLQREADRDRRTLSDYVRIVLEDHLKQREG